MYAQLQHAPYLCRIDNHQLVRSKSPPKYGGHGEPPGTSSTYHELVGLVHLSRISRDVKLTLPRARQARHLKHPTTE